MAKEPFVALLTVKWTGAIIIWLVSFGKRKLAVQLEERHDSLNILVGYLFSLIVLGIIVFYLFGKD